MLVIKLKPTVLLATGIALLLSCGKKPAETASDPIEVDTTKYQRVDSVTSIIPKSALRDTVLTVTADSVNALYYPNTGKVVMKLKRVMCAKSRAPAGMTLSMAKEIFGSE